tara:strand:+ start:1143 stop:1724 length:582 start_codon:yes stop_codon:yes gene_type:complete
MSKINKSKHSSDFLERSVPIVSTASLYKAVIAAATFSSLLLVLVILPAEYKVDPTGFGAAVGLNKLTNNDISTSQAMINENKNLLAVAQNDSVEIEIPSGQSLEYKLKVLKDVAVKYSWKTSGEELYFDLHGEPLGDTTGYFESYTVSTAKSVHGSFVAPFNGSHGWYWENKGEKPVIVTLNIEGNYEVEGKK